MADWGTLWPAGVGERDREPRPVKRWEEDAAM